MIKFILDAAAIVAAVIWLIELGSNGSLTVEHIGFVIVALVIIMAVIRSALKKDTVRHFIEIAIVVGILITFLIWHSGGDLKSLGAISGQIIILFIALIGIYIMVYKGFGGGKD